MDSLGDLLDKYPYRVVAMILSLDQEHVLRIAFDDGTYEVFSKRKLNSDQIDDLKKGLSPRDISIIDL
jgi:hypothetical protein